MITSRTHAALDATLSVMLAGLAICPALTRRERVLSGAVAAGLTGLGAVTDYEGGIVPKLSLRTHRALEAAGGGALIAAGLRGEKGRWLAAVGLAQLALAAFASDAGQAGPPDPAYQPLGTPKPFTDQVWVVDDVMHGILPLRMTVVKLSNGDLLLHSPTQYSAALHRALTEIGPVRHLVAPSIAHWLFVKAWQDAIPDAVTWAAPKLRERSQVRRAGLRIDHVLADRPPPDWQGEVDQALVRGHFGFRELAFFHRPSRTAMVTDLVQNFELDRLPWLLRPIARLIGNVAPISRAPSYLRAIVGRRDRAAGRRIVDWAPERLIVTHGLPITTDAAASLRRSLSWLTG